MEEVISQLAADFRRMYESIPRFFQAPGRVNLIGEHTDYNEGFVMPFAIDRRAIVAGAARADSTINVHALDLRESARIDLSKEPRFRRGNWIDYVEGMARTVAMKFGRVNGADLLLTSSVPIGAGLSSSAAIEIALGLAFIHLNDLPLDRCLLAFAGQQAEHEYVGTRSGIMDQFASIFGERDRAMLLDCRSLEIEHITVLNNDTEIAVVDTMVKHNLASSSYNERRRECEEAVKLLRTRLPGIRSLRDVTSDDLERHGSLLSETLLRRCRHVVSENARTLLAAQAFREHDAVAAGQLMFASHMSLRDDYEVSCAELDFLVETARKVGGVFGARMTGGGFGGCTVNLVKKSVVDEFRNVTVTEYAKRFGKEPAFYLFRPSAGASEIVDI